MLTSTLHRHARFLASFVLGLLLWAVSSSDKIDPLTRDLVGVNGFFLCYLFLMGVMIIRTTPDGLRRHAEADDEGGTLILILALASVGFSLWSIFQVLNLTNLSVPQALFALLAAPLGWATIHVLAAFRYAHLYYAPTPDGGLDFPGTKVPSIWDFLYFSFTIGMTAQVSDVVVTTGAIRKVVLLHGIGSFFFNTVILALAVNAALALSKIGAAP